MIELEASDWKMLRIRRVYKRRWMMAIVIPGGKRMLPSKFDDIIISWLLVKCHCSLGYGWRKKSKHNPTGGTALRRIDLFNVFSVDRTFCTKTPRKKIEYRTSVLRVQKIDFSKREVTSPKSRLLCSVCIPVSLHSSFLQFP